AQHVIQRFLVVIGWDYDTCVYGRENVAHGRIYFFEKPAKYPLIISTSSLSSILGKASFTNFRSSLILSLYFRNLGKFSWTLSRMRRTSGLSESFLTAASIHSMASFIFDFRFVKGS